MISIYLEGERLERVKSNEKNNSNKFLIKIQIVVALLLCTICTMNTTCIQ